MDTIGKTHVNHFWELIRVNGFKFMSALDIGSLA